MMNEFIEFVDKISNFINSSNESARLLINVRDPELRSLFLEELFKRIEDVDASFDTFWINHEEEMIGIEDVKRMADFLRYPPSYTKRKYVISEEFSNTSRESLAAMLKITEEPPKYAAFLCFTFNVMKLLSTVRSRFSTFYLNVRGDSILNPDRLNEIEENVPRELLSVPSVAFYASHSPQEVMKVLSVEDPFTALHLLGEAVEGGKPSFILQFTAERVLLGVNIKNFVGVLSRTKSILKENESKVLNAFLDAALVIFQDLTILKKSNYWRGIKRKGYMSAYLEFKKVDFSMIEWLLSCRNTLRKTKINSRAIMGLLFAKFIAMKMGSGKS